jgi:hypothetical protein
MDVETTLDGCRANAELLLEMTSADAYNLKMASGMIIDLFR